MARRLDSRDSSKLLELLRRQSEEAIRFAAVFGDAHDLHQTDVAALAAIAQAAGAGAPLGPAALAQALNLSRPATTALLNRLERAGHVIRQPDPADRRRAVLEMQPQANELASAFFGPLGAAFRAVMSDYSDDELEIVAAFLTDVIDATITTRTQVSSAPSVDVVGEGDGDGDGNA